VPTGCSFSRTWSLDSLLRGNDPDDLDRQRREVGEFLSGLVERYDGVVVRPCFEVESVFEADPIRTQNLRQRQPQGPAYVGGKQVSIDAVPGGLANRIPEQSDGLGGGRFGEPYLRWRAVLAAHLRVCGRPLPWLERSDNRCAAVCARRLTDLVEILCGRIDGPQQGAEQREAEQSDDDVERYQRPTVCFQANPGVLPVRQ
jgi:hypothetical protein